MPSFKEDPAPVPPSDAAPPAIPAAPSAPKAYSAIHALQQPSMAELANRLLPVVHHVVIRYRSYLPANVEFGDLRSVGIEAMMETIRRYPGKDEDSLGRLVRRRVQGAILDELRRRDWASRTVRRKARHYEETLAQLEQRLKRPPTDEELRKALKLTPAAFSKLLEELRPITWIPLDSVRSGSDEGDDNWHDKIADPAADVVSEQLEHRESIELLADAIQALPQVPKKVIAMYYYEEMRLAEIAEIFGLTESRICQIHTQAVLSLRVFLRNLDSKESGGSP